MLGLVGEGLFSAHSLSPELLPGLPEVSFLTGALGGLLMIGALLAFFFTKHEQYLRVNTALYWVLLALMGSIISTSGLFTSPYLPLFSLALLFSAALSATTHWFVTGLLTVYVVTLFLGYGPKATPELISTLLTTGAFPLFVSYILWGNHRAADKESTEERSYRELATELSQVAGKSEVVINAIADGVIAVSSKGQIELINPSAQRMVGWGKQDAIGLDYKSVLKIVDTLAHEVTPINDPIAKALVENKEVDTEAFDIVTSSGKSFMASIVVSPVSEAKSGAIIVFRDITKQKSEERQQAEFISTASHEMRTPVAAIEGYLGLALNPSTATVDEKARGFLLKAHESAQHLGRLFQDLLDVSKADDNRMKNVPRVINLVEFTENVVQSLAPRAIEKNLELLFLPTGYRVPESQADTEPNGREKHKRLHPVFMVNVDPDHLREVLSNLIENAIKYTPDGSVTINISGDEKRAQVSIADTGIGIAKEDQPHLFQKFYRIDNTDTREIGGTGLGLYLCRRLIEAMEGKIWLESDFKKGSTFFVEFDRLEREKANRLKAEQAAQDAEAPKRPAPVVELPPLVPAATPAATTSTAPPPPPPPPPASVPTPAAQAPIAATPQSQPQPAPPPTPAVAPPTTTPPTPTIEPSLSDIEQNKSRYVYTRQTAEKRNNR